MKIYVAKNGSQMGPFTPDQLGGLVQAGFLSMDDLSWEEGGGNDGEEDAGDPASGFLRQPTVATTRAATRTPARRRMASGY